MGKGKTEESYKDKGRITNWKRKREIYLEKNKKTKIELQTYTERKKKDLK
jgi:hypothetical protein